MVRSVALVVFLGGCGRIAFDPTSVAIPGATEYDIYVTQRDPL